MNKIIAPRSSLWAIALTVTTCVAAIAISTGAAAEDADQSADQTIVAQATTTPPAPAAAPDAAGASAWAALAERGACLVLVHPLGARDGQLLPRGS